MPPEADTTQAPETTAPADAQAQAQPPEPPKASDDLTGLKNTVTALRNDVKTLQNQLKSYDGIDPTAARDALTRVGELETTNQQLAQEKQALTVDLALTRELNDALPDYRDLLWNSTRTQLHVNDQGHVVGNEGRSLSEIVGGLRQQHQTMFAADIPTGAGTQPGSSTQPTSPQVVSATNGVITGVDPQDIISGKVTVQP